MSLSPYKTIGLAREVESPENPGALEKRVALIPSDIKKLVDFGVQVFVENGAGEGVGYLDEQYVSAGACLQGHEEIYKDKDLIIKFKGPSVESIDWMRPGCTLFCMAHFYSFPARAAKLEKNKINVVAMEFVVESPKVFEESIILSKVAMQSILAKFEGRQDQVNVGFLGYSDRVVGAIRRAGNRHSNSLTVYQLDVDEKELEHFEETSVYFYDSKVFEDHKGIIKFLSSKGCTLFDLKEFEDRDGEVAVAEYRATHHPFEKGLRRIQCLHETGQAGCRYGFKLLLDNSAKKKTGKDARALIFGYGNVGMGAIHEAYDQGVRVIHILGARNTHPDRVEYWLEHADVIVNGAEQPVELRGKNYLVTRDHVRAVLQEGTVVIDLVGGSLSNRSPVENVEECTFLTDPYFIEDGVYFSALWGWPMMGMMRETAIRYSGQIVDVLLGREALIQGLKNAHPGIKPAIVCGPF